MGRSEDGRWDPAHHPFTAPRPEDLDRLDRDPGAVRSLAYDLVLNGYELGAGSIRIHDAPTSSSASSTLLGIDAEEAEERFGFLLDALATAPRPTAASPSASTASCMLLAGEPSIRDVIAFPKTQSGADPLTGAPTPVDPAQLAEVRLRPLDPPARPARSRLTTGLSGAVAGVGWRWFNAVLGSARRC